MARARRDGDHLIFHCPGCDLLHAPTVGGAKRWEWNGSLDLPTLSPSVLVRWDDGPDHVQKVCHSFVREGRIQFLGDCTHALAGQTIDLPDVERASE